MAAMKTTLRSLFVICWMLWVQPVGAQYIFRHLDIVDGLSDNQIRSLSMIPDGRLAVKTASILNVYNGAAFEQFTPDKWQEYRWDYFKTPQEYYDNQGRIWMKECDHLLLLDLHTNEFIYNIEEELYRFGVEKKLINLFIDEDKNYWFVTEDKSFLCYDVRKDSLLTITEGSSEFARIHGIPREMTQYKNFYWIIYSDGLICLWDSTSGEFVSRDETFLSSLDDTADKIYINTSDKDRLYMHTTDTGDLWLMLSDGIYYFSRMNALWKEVCTISGFSNFFTCMDLDREGNVWVGTSRTGLRFIEKESFEVHTLPGMKLDTGGMIYNDVFSVFVDDYNGL
ncbi:MAG: hypothetical protein LUE93_07785 [Bacteroides sp.]|nr:hypothetical protein [Bacteroides sp.]